MKLQIIASMDGFVVLMNGFFYFSYKTAAEARESAAQLRRIFKR